MLRIPTRRTDAVSRQRVYLVLAIHRGRLLAYRTDIA